MTEPGDNERVVDEIIEAEGRIDVLINNAGFGLYGPVEDVPLDDARYQFEVNLFGLARLTQLVLPYMREKRWGKIVNISSIWGMTAHPHDSNYCAAKAALLGLTKAWAKELAPWNIRVNAVSPGPVETNFLKPCFSTATVYEPTCTESKT